MQELWKCNLQRVLSAVGVSGLKIIAKIEYSHSVKNRTVGNKTKQWRLRMVWMTMRHSQNSGNQELLMLFL